MRNKFYAVKTEFTCPASTSNSQSSSSSMSLRHEQGLTPFPFNQYWNISRQHASGSPWFLILIASNFAPDVSNSNWPATLMQPLKLSWASFLRMSSILINSLMLEYHLYVEGTIIITIVKILKLIITWAHNYSACTLRNLLLCAWL